jgi:hypothetical protein
MKAMLDFQDNESEERHTKFPTTVLSWIGMMKIRTEKWGEVWTSLRDNEVVHVEKLCDAM